MITSVCTLGKEYEHESVEKIAISCFLSLRHRPNVIGETGVLFTGRGNLLAK